MVWCSLISVEFAEVMEPHAWGARLNTPATTMQRSTLQTMLCVSLERVEGALTIQRLATTTPRLDSTTDRACSTMSAECAEVQAFPEGECDCNGNQVDALGVCGGGCLNDVNGNGLCDDEEVFGCPDPEACNYDPTVGFDDGSCLFDDECGVCGGSGIPEGECDCNGNQEDACGVCGGDGSSCAGCTNPLAWNYDVAAILDDGSCCFNDPFPASGNCATECTGDSDGDGICDNLEVVGCQDENACNHIYYATDSGDCDYSCYGCMDPVACNYGEGAQLDDGSCFYGGCNDPWLAIMTQWPCVMITPVCILPLRDVLILTHAITTKCSCAMSRGGDCLYADACGECGGSGMSGCTDEEACNYDIEATCDDGSCLVFGELCDDENGMTFNDVVTENCLCQGVLDIFGCMDSSACNFNPEATSDNGSCTTVDECGVCGGSGIQEGACDCEGNVIDAIGVCGGVCTSDINSNGVCDALEVYGCTYASALNYNPSATSDDGSCELNCQQGVLGCTYDLAENFDALATTDDGTCVFKEVPPPCLVFDGDGDGAVGASDLLGLLTEFGASCD